MFFLLSSALFSQNKYIGAAKCKMCHNAEAKGKQYTKWTESQHSKAFKTLQGEAAKKIAKEKGVANPTTDAKCVKCHSTALAINASLNGGITKEEGVSCESCHGPGSAYKSPTIMKNLAERKKNGLIVPDEALCKTCHNSTSPTFKSFDFKTQSAKVAHPGPKK
ncbi:MAG: cytochrome C554 [Bacteroidetes bacterium CG23_combo_of_CG06-09_8_20_14_all_32_9]|nr:MAG: cytochrome C554 [Bacteroidetes bacterium CG23_combo_of_CG06-09_8_20_14_all_32_9]